MAITGSLNQLIAGGSFELDERVSYLYKQAQQIKPHNQGQKKAINVKKAQLRPKLTQ